MTDVKNFFNQPINSNIKTHQNVRKIATGQGDDYMTDCLLVYFYFNENVRKIATGQGDDYTTDFLLVYF